MLQEAIANVAKHADADQCTVILGEQDDGYLVRVVDDGIGTEHVETDFETPAGHLGLVLMRERAALAGGWFRISSIARQWHHRHVLGAARRRPAIQRSRLMRYRVLIVEDHQVVAEGLAALLNEHPELRVVAIASGVGEVEHLADVERIDVVLCDYWLPDGTGPEAVAALRVAPAGRGGRVPQRRQQRRGGSRRPGGRGRRVPGEERRRGRRRRRGPPGGRRGDPGAGPPAGEAPGAGGGNARTAPRSTPGGWTASPRGSGRSSA